MNVLDENVADEQREALRDRRVAVKQIGHDIGYKSMTDREILPLLHGLSRATFFTRDNDFYRRGLCHRGYCLVFLDVSEKDVAKYVVRALRHPELKTWASRAGTVVRVSSQGVWLWRLHGESEIELPW